MSDLAVKASQPIALQARLNEDWLAVVIGLLVFAAALLSISGIDLLGWAVTTSVYTDLGQALGPFAKAYGWLGGGGALLATYAALLVVLSGGVVTLGGDVRKFAIAYALPGHVLNLGAIKSTHAAAATAAACSIDRNN